MNCPTHEATTHVEDPINTSEVLFNRKTTLEELPDILHQLRNLSPLDKVLWSIKTLTTSDIDFPSNARGLERSIQILLACDNPVKESIPHISIVLPALTAYSAHRESIRATIAYSDDQSLQEDAKQVGTTMEAFLKKIVGELDTQCKRYKSGMETL